MFAGQVSACWVLVLFALAGWHGPVSASSPLADTIDRVRPAIVGVGLVRREPRRVETTFSGTGFAVGDGTRVLTNYHVYQGIVKGRHKGGELAVFSGRGERAKVHRVVVEQVDPVHDLALLRLRTGRLPALQLADDRLLREGEDIAFTGFPIGMVVGLYPVTHRGIISAITPIVIPANSAKSLKAEQIRRIRERRYPVYQIDGTAYPGSSGSPVYLAGTGEVVAVINSVFVKGSKEAALEHPSGISYAIPVKYVNRLLRKNKSGK